LTPAEAMVDGTARGLPTPPVPEWVRSRPLEARAVRSTDPTGLGPDVHFRKGVT
jgi:hypothetical protein